MAKERVEDAQHGKRFEFGANWSRFLSVVDNERIAEAQNSLKQMLATEDLRGKTFVDVGSGSGLFSLSARMMGAKVYSFDYDPKSVACTQELRRRFYPDDNDWVVEQGSILDEEYLGKLGQFDTVYSWGVLHHTGHMWKALENVVPLVADRGQLFIAIYNDQGRASRGWTRVKRIYCSGLLGRFAVKLIFYPYFALGRLFADVLKGRNPLTSYAEYKKVRGMSVTHDWVDWLGGYPFEVAKPEQIFDFYRQRGFVMARMKTCGGGLGCNEFVFTRKI